MPKEKKYIYIKSAMPEEKKNIKSAMPEEKKLKIFKWRLRMVRMVVVVVVVAAVVDHFYCR